MKQMLKRFISWGTIAFLCMHLLPFAAVYAAEEQTMDIAVRVEAEGALPANPETYRVRLTALEDNAPMPSGTSGGSMDQEIEGPGQDSFHFAYTAPGVYSYLIQQIPGASTHCAYDETVYTLYVYVTNAENGTLDINAYIVKGSAEEKYEEAVFRNAYTGSAKYDPPIRKTVRNVKGTAPSNSVFSFRMSPQNPDDPMPDNQKAKLDSSTGSLTMDVRGPGEYEFGWMYYDQTHVGKTYIYTVEEIDNGESFYTYDKNIYKLTVKVLAGEDGIELKTFITDKNGEASEMVFTNDFNKKDDQPDKPEKPEKPDEPDKPDKPDKPQNPDKPANPDKPKNPEKPDKPSGTSTSKIHHSSSTTGSGKGPVRTGDTTNIWLWAGLAAASVLIISFLFFLHRRTDREDE